MSHIASYKELLFHEGQPDESVPSDEYSMHSLISDATQQEMHIEEGTFKRIFSQFPTLTVKDINVHRIGADAKIILGADGKPAKLKAGELKSFEKGFKYANHLISDFKAKPKNERVPITEFGILFAIRVLESLIPDVEFKDRLIGYSESMLVYSAYGRGTVSMDSLNSLLSFVYSNLQGKLCMGLIRWGSPAIPDFHAAQLIQSRFMAENAEVLPLPDNLRQCNLCGKASTRMQHCVCSKIPLPSDFKTVQYCSRECQKTHWIAHKDMHALRLEKSAIWKENPVEELEKMSIASGVAAGAASSAPDAKTCVVCGVQAPLQCKCGTLYCSKDCQMKNWKVHKKLCKA